MHTWRHVSHNQPCHICDKPDWCARSADGVWALCRRADTGAGLHKVDKSGADYWLYHLDGHLPCQHHSLELPSLPCTARAEPAVLDQVYHALLAALPLSSTHRQALRQRGLPDVEILRRNYRTLPLDGRASAARRVVDRFGPDVSSTIPGVYIAKHDGRQYWSIAGVPGVLILVRNLDGRIVALQIRCDDSAPGAKYVWLSSAKHGGPGPGAPVHVPLHIDTPPDIVRVTEGPLKADITTALSGVLTIGLPGVALWRQALPLLDVLQPARVLLSFDSDWRQNHHVARALGHAARALVKAGYEVQVEDWDPAQGKGIDDLLAAGHTPALQSVALAFGALLRGQARVWTDTLATRAAGEVAPWH
jgi:DNA primase